MNHLLVAALSSAALLSPVALAQTTWIVDDDGGPGVDFTTIVDAIEIAAPGDIIDVLPGLYARFTLRKGVTIIGAEPAPGASFPVRIYGIVSVQQVPVGQLAVLASVELDEVDALLCEGTVLIESMDAEAVRVELCKDVRIQTATIWSSEGPSIVVANSRLSLHRTTVEGEYNQLFPGVLLEGDLTLVASQCRLRGHRGFDPFVWPLGCTDGGPAIELLGTGVEELHFIDTVVEGGDPGIGCMQGRAFSGCTASTRIFATRSPISACAAADVTYVADRPSADFEATQSPGESVELALRLRPFVYTWLSMGAAPAVAPASGGIPLLNTGDRRILLGVSDAAGGFLSTLEVPSAMRGCVFLFQPSMVVSVGNEQFANPLALVVR